jgi:hypothetical protein
MYEYRSRDIANLKDNRVYIRTAMPFGTRLNLKLLQYDIHHSTIEVHFPTEVEEYPGAESPILLSRVWVDIGSALSSGRSQAPLSWLD